MREAVPPAKVPPPLVWPNGQLMRTEALAREVAAPRMASVRSILSAHPASGLTPIRLAQLLRAAEDGDATAYLELAEEMEEKDLHYLAQLGTRKRAVAQLPITVEAASDAAHHKEHADFIRKWLDRDMLQAEIFDILDAIGKGYSVTEMIWSTRPGKWVPQDLKWRFPQWFEFDRINGETLKLRTAGEPAPLEAGKFIVHVSKAKSGLPIRGGLARAVAWGWMFKNFSIKDWVSFLETYGMPLRVGRYDNGETEDNIAILARAVADLGSDAAAVFPKTMEVEFIDGKGGSAPGDLWRSMAEYIDDQVSKVVLGQTNTADAKAGGLGSGQAEVHNDVRLDIRDYDAAMLGATIRRDIVVPMVMFNFGPQDEYPRIKVGEVDSEDVETLLRAASALVPLGVKVGARQMAEKTGLPQPEPGEEVLQAAASPIAENLPSGAPSVPREGLRPRATPTPALLNPLKSPDGQIGVATAASTREREPDAIDEAADAFLDDWTELVEPLLGPIEELLAASSSLAEFRDGLAGTIGAMDDGKVAALLARAGFAARVAGDAAQQDDEREVR
jgi:phage gp29-like protein